MDLGWGALSSSLRVWSRRERRVERFLRDWSDSGRSKRAIINYLIPSALRQGGWTGGLDEIHFRRRGTIAAVKKDGMTLRCSLNSTRPVRAARKCQLAPFPFGRGFLFLRTPTTCPYTHTTPGSQSPPPGTRPQRGTSRTAPRPARSPAPARGRRRRAPTAVRPTP